MLALIAADKLRQQLALILQPHAQLSGYVDDVVGEDVAAADDDPGALFAQVVSLARRPRGARK